MAIRSAHSTAADPHAAAADIRRGFDGMTPKLVLFFASSRYAPDEIARHVHDAVGGGATTIGCTTAGEITRGKMLEGGIAAMALDDDSVGSVSVARVEDPKSNESVARALAALADAAAPGTTPAALDATHHVGLVLHDGMSGTEERVMGALSSQTNVPFIGGSAGDDAKFAATHVFHDGSAHTGQTLLALVRPIRPYEILKTQSFAVLDETLVVTKADESTRTAYELNGKPATTEYARALGVSEADLPSHFMSHPVGLVLSSGEPFVRSPREVDGTAIVFYCHVKEGMELRVLESRDIVADTARELEAKLASMGACQGIVNFHCILRTLELKAKDQTGPYGAVFANVPTVGFSTYGESYIGHINQTSTMVLFR